MTTWRWFAFGLPGILHVATPWRSDSKPGGDVGHEPLCGNAKGGPIEVEPTGERRCIRCRQLMLSTLS